MSEFLSKREIKGKVDSKFGESHSSLRAERGKLGVSPTHRDSSVASLPQNDREGGPRLPRHSVPRNDRKRQRECHGTLCLAMTGKRPRDCHVAEAPGNDRKKTKGLPRRPDAVGAPRNDKKYARFDLEWDDGELFPEVVYPDAEFLFRRMNEVTLECVNPRGGEAILDIGCGRGIDGVEVAKKDAGVIGLEPSNGMISKAREHISQNGASMSLVQGVGEHLPFQLRSFDRIVCKGALDHFPDPAMVMEQVALVLRPEGKAIIA